MSTPTIGDATTAPPAALTASQRLAALSAASSRHRLLQSTLRAGVVRDVLHLWLTQFDPARPDATWQTLQTALTALIRDRRNTSSGLASAFYRQSRALSGITGDFVPLAPDQLPADMLDATQNATGIAAYFRAIGNGQTDTDARTTGGVLLSGSTSRLVLDAGRQTATATAAADPKARGWIRVTDANPCAFCALLASRSAADAGAYYKSAATAGGNANAKFDGGGDFKFHDHCSCVAEAVFRGQRHPGEDVAEELYAQYLHVQRTSKTQQSPLNKWRTYWESDQRSQPENGSIEHGST